MSNRKPRPRKPRDLVDLEYACRTRKYFTGTGWRNGTAIRCDYADLSPRDLRRLAKWALAAAAWLEANDDR